MLKTTIKTTLEFLEVYFELTMVFKESIPVSDPERLINLVKPGFKSYLKVVK